MNIQNSLWCLVLPLDMDAIFKGFILKKMYFEVSDTSLSLHILSEGGDVPSGSELPLCTKSAGVTARTRVE